MSYINDEIKRIGIKFIGHYGKSELRVQGSNWYVVIPQNRIGEFCQLFPDVDWESGEYLNVLEGRYVRITMDADNRVTFIKHIVKDITYYTGPFLDILEEK